jgi:hypothetical protein
LEIKTGLSVQRITLQTNLEEYHESGLADILKPH